jgi:hypothetical protein
VKRAHYDAAMLSARIVLLASALAVALALVGIPSAANAKTTQRCNGDAALCARTLDQVVLPSTHNSMSAESLGFGLPNQQVGIPDQLKLGVRGFLIDTYYGVKQPDGRIANAAAGTKGDGIFLCHVVCLAGATPLVDVLRAYKDFLAKNPNEVLVFDIEDHVTPKDYAKVVKQSGLDKFAYRGKKFGPWPTLAQMISSKQQVVMLAESSKVTGIPYFRSAYEGILQETPYTWPTRDEITKKSLLDASCRPNRGGTTGSLFLMNHWFPATGANDTDAKVVNATSALVNRGTACFKRRKRVPNLLAVDRFKVGGLVTAAKKLNAELGPKVKPATK